MNSSDFMSILRYIAQRHKDKAAVKERNKLADVYELSPKQKQVVAELNALTIIGRYTEHAEEILTAYEQTADK